ncbi:ThiF family adenylyltransferase [bacterium]|nr:ThiF family adenylyltransferase [bacterium]MCB2179335.1 ThiF family adenylyltransferase [bacterium]
MSQPQISLSEEIIAQSPDLSTLREQGFDIEVILGTILVLRNVPYVNRDKNVNFGTLVSPLELAGNKTIPPTNHQTWFIGEHPCDGEGNEIQGIKHGSNKKAWGGGVITDHDFSAKPHGNGRYRDYEEKMGTYFRIISGPAEQLDNSVTAHIYEPAKAVGVEYPFEYPDTASTRAGIRSINDRLAVSKVAVVGLGGTGAYILDLIVKTPIAEIHLFDDDEFLNHNAFRSPGAADKEVVQISPKKVTYFHDQYSQLHTGIVSHDTKVNGDNVSLLSGMDFVFIAIDDNPSRKIIVDFLMENQIPFIDVGIGIYSKEDKLGGIVRVTTGDIEMMDMAYRNLPFNASDENNENNEYNQNIQVADLNALNASLAVIRWKKLFGFYHDFESEYKSNYTIDGNIINNEKKATATDED